MGHRCPRAAWGVIGASKVGARASMVRAAGAGDRSKGLCLDAASRGLGCDAWTLPTRGRAPTPIRQVVDPIPARRANGPRHAAERASCPQEGDQQEWTRLEVQNAVDWTEGHDSNDEDRASEHCPGERESIGRNESSPRACKQGHACESQAGGDCARQEERPQPRVPFGVPGFPFVDRLDRFATLGQKRERRDGRFRGLG
jgi:hypothetical protein